MIPHIRRHACCAVLAIAMCATGTALADQSTQSTQATQSANDTTSVLTVPASKPSPSPGIHAPKPPERFEVNLVTTQVQQYHGAFPAAYSGSQSITKNADTAKTVGADLFLGARIGQDTGVYVTEEMDQGFGLGTPPSAKGSLYSGTIGAAGYPSGESYKVGSNSSYSRVNRAFIRQTFNFGGDRQTVDPDIQQLGGSLAPDNLIVTVGKFSVADIFDTNPYAHDPSNDFLNWSVIDMGAFDYAADSLGYTYGASAELSNQNSTLRGGLFQLSTTPNALAIEPHPLDQYQAVMEFEQRTSFFGGHAGAIKGIVYADTGYMGSYADAVDLAEATSSVPSTASVRDDKHTKFGAGLNLAQEIAPNVGAFARASAMNGTYETYDFTDIDRSLSAGLTINGNLYHRPKDAFGFAAAINDLSQPGRAYFAAGGMGLLIGDGGLAYGSERILETYYRLGFGRDYGVTLDYQKITNPGYNSARGPLDVLGLRYHVQL